MSTVNRQFRIAARPVGMVKESDFEYAEVKVPDIADGQARIRTTYLSLDPSMRGQIEIAPTMGRRSRSATSCAPAASASSRHPRTGPAGRRVGRRLTRHPGLQRHRRQSLPVRVYPVDADPTVALGVSAAPA